MKWNWQLVSYTISFSSSGFATTTLQATIGSKNVKPDLIDLVVSSENNPSTPSPTPTPSPQPTTINGTSRSDTLIGTTGDDILSGLGGSDKLHGGAGNDIIDGGRGNDTLWGGPGKNILTGGPGKDIFVFDAPFIGAIDTITDFSPVDDTIYLDNAIFTNLPTGRLKATAFHIGTARTMLQIKSFMMHKLWRPLLWRQ